MKFSVIVPVYNCERYLKRCIKSILNQTYKNFELILINDGSIDRSIEICREAASLDNRVIIIEQENQGPGAARNNGIKNATGDFIVFIDSDDYIEEFCFAELQDYLHKHCVDILFKGFKFEDQKTGEILDEIRLPQGIYNKWQFHSIIKILIDTDLFGYTWCKVVKTDLLRDFHLEFNTKYSLHEDLLLVCEMCEKAENLGVLDTTSYHYTKDDDTLCTKFRNDMVENMEFVNNQIFDFYKRMKIDDMDEMIIKRAVFSIFLILKNYALVNYQKDFYYKYKKFLNGKTVEEIRNRKKKYLQVIKGKKKWVVYFICISKNTILFKTIIDMYSKLYHNRRN